MPDRFDEFTDRTRKVLSFAQDEAQRLQHKYIGTEHILLGLLRHEDSVAGQILQNLGVSFARARSAVDLMIPTGEGAASGEIGLTSRAKKVVELAVDEARRLNHHYIGTEHVLLGLIREGQGVGARVLESLGVRLEQVREQVPSAEAEQPGSEKGPREWRMSSFGSGMSRRTLTSAIPSPPRPALRKLLGVIPIAQSQTVGGVTVTVLSLETYADGFLVNVRILSDLAVPTIYRFPELVLSAVDDRANRYEGPPWGGSGNAEQWRGAYAFGPALNPATSELRLEISEIRWHRPGEAPGFDVQAGPWVIPIALA